MESGREIGVIMKKLSTLILMSALLCALGTTTEAKADARQNKKPNILFIAIDDLNDWTDMLAGNPQAKTPHMDKLAAQGMTFTNAHCAAPACNPSRAALMTSIAPYRSGVYGNPQPWKPVLKDKVTLSQHFMQHGYRAMGSGKIYHGSYPDPESWDEYWPSRNLCGHQVVTGN